MAAPEPLWPPGSCGGAAGVGPGMAASPGRWVAVAAAPPVAQCVLGASGRARILTLVCVCGCLCGRGRLKVIKEGCSGRRAAFLCFCRQPAEPRPCHGRALVGDPPRVVGWGVHLSRSVSRARLQRPRYTIHHQTWRDAGHTDLGVGTCCLLPSGTMARPWPCVCGCVTCPFAPALETAVISGGCKSLWPVADRF